MKATREVPIIEKPRIIPATRFAPVRREWRGAIERLTGREPSQMRARLPYPGGELGR